MAEKTEKKPEQPKNPYADEVSDEEFTRQFKARMKERYETGPRGIRR